MQRSIIAPAERITNLRWVIAGILGFGVIINYIDRGALSVAAKPLHDELGMGPEQFGILSSAFFAVYAFSQIPIGYILDRFGLVVNGQRSGNSNISIDGVDFNDPLTPPGQSPKGVYFIVRWRPPYVFSMVKVSAAPTPGCTEKDPGADDEPRTLFP